MRRPQVVPVVALVWYFALFFVALTNQPQLVTGVRSSAGSAPPPEVLAIIVRGAGFGNTLVLDRTILLPEDLRWMGNQEWTGSSRRQVREALVDLTRRSKLPWGVDTAAVLALGARA